VGSIACTVIFPEAPTIAFEPRMRDCPHCNEPLLVRKTRVRKIATLHVGPFKAKETERICKICKRVYRSEELEQLVPEGANFGYDVMDYIGKGPMLISALDSLSKIVLGNAKMPSEKAETIVPFLKNIERTFGLPLALVHDMGSGLQKAVATVFPDSADFICHFHFLRDLGKDLFEREYTRILNRLRSHGITTKLHNYAKELLRTIYNDSCLVDSFTRAFHQGDKPSSPTNPFAQ